MHDVSSLHYVSTRHNVRYIACNNHAFAILTAVTVYMYMYETLTNFYWLAMLHAIILHHNYPLNS